MAWKNVGYNGKVTEVTLQQSALGRGPARFSVRGENDFTLTVAGNGGTLSAGEGTAYGVTSTQDAVSPVTFGAVSTGTRWDLVAIRRDSTPPLGGTTSIVVIPGGPSKALPVGLKNDPGNTVDQPLWLVPVTNAGAGAPVDLRVWWNDGGLVAAGPEALLYMDELGTYIHILSEAKSYRRKKQAGALVWAVENTGPAGPTPAITAGTVSTLPAGSAATFTITGTPENPVINVGLPQGAQGIPSAIAMMKGTVATVSALPATGNAKNDAYIVSSPTPAHLHFWTGTAWQDLGPFQGPTGPAGATTWGGIVDPPATFPPTIGTTATTAKAGNWAPGIGDVTGLTDALTARTTIVKVTTGTETRPAGFTTVIWAGGTTRPTNAATGDLWLKEDA